MQNKFLRDEIVNVKGEREIAEALISRIEQKCKEAIDGKHDSIRTRELFEVLYGFESTLVQKNFVFTLPSFLFELFSFHRLHLKLTHQN